MAGFTSIRDYVDSIDAGQCSFYTFRKAPTTSSIGTWIDLSMASGNPIPNYYASSPLVAATLNGAEGLFHGGAVAPQTKHLKSLLLIGPVTTPLPMTVQLLDYLLYYPFVDSGTNDPQTLTNAVTLPRYTDGEGVQVMAVWTNGPAAPTGLTFTFDYVNQDGDTVTSPTQTMGAGVLAQSLVTGNRTASGGQFLTLNTGDTGVRSVESFTMTAGLDVGLLALVLVKPLATHGVLDITAPVERDFLLDFPSLPRIVDGAYLGLIAQVQGNAGTSTFFGAIETIWS